MNVGVNPRACYIYLKDGPRNRISHRRALKSVYNRTQELKIWVLICECRVDLQCMLKPWQLRKEKFNDKISGLH